MPKVPEHMTFQYLSELKAHHAAWRLLRADQAPLVASFFYREFEGGRRRGVEARRLVEHLDDFLYDAEQQGSQGQGFGRSPQEYLEIWTDAAHGWLRKYEYRGDWYYDLTSAAQKALEWLSGLRKQEFVGTESRLRTVFALLKEIGRETDLDAEHRLSYLREQQEKLAAEIEEIERTGVVRPRLSEVQIKERFLQAEETAAAILADFREVEDNFRALTRRVQDEVISWTRGKGELLEKIFEESDLIRNSEQGKSFNAFWRYLMAPGQRESFRETLAQVSEAEPLQGLLRDHSLAPMQREWAKAAGSVQQTLAALSAQLRRYVDEEYLREERAIYELIAGVEQQAIVLRKEGLIGIRDQVMDMMDVRPGLSLPMERRLYAPPRKTMLTEVVPTAGAADSSEESMKALYTQARVDRDRLKSNIDELLKTKPEVELSEVVAAYPLQQGLAELLEYVLLASREKSEAFDGSKMMEICYARDGRELAAICSRIVYRR